MINLLSLFFKPSPRQRLIIRVLFIVLIMLGLVVAMVPSNYIDTGLEISDKVMHATAFFGFAVLLDIISEKPFWRWQVPVLVAYGALIEVLQSFVSWRTFSLLDLVADVVGVLLYWLLVVMWIKPLVPAAHDRTVVHD